MDAGREMDALVAEKVMGLTLDYEFEQITNAPNVRELRSKDDEWGILPHYSTDIADAWQVIERLKDLGWAIELMDMRGNPNKGDKFRGWWYELNRWDDPDALVDGVQFASHYAELDGGGAYTAPLAICSAALKAVGVTL